jgi:hypothetical protein
MMAKTQETTQDSPAVALAPLLAWLLPGLGHWWIGERVRGIIFFIVLTVTFWGGVAVGGVGTTVTPTENGAWIAAQLCMGPQALGALYLNYRTVENAKARGDDTYKAPWPASTISVVYAGVAGMLNLLVIIDALARADARRTLTLERSPPKKRAK